MSLRLRRARRLRAGDRVAVVSPAGPAPEEDLERGAAVLRGWGLVVDPIEARTHPRLPYLAGTDAERAAEFTRAWCDPEVRAVFCARGGYGSTRTLEALDLDALAAAEPGILVGSSDVTALHQALVPFPGTATFLGPMPTTTAFLQRPEVREGLRRVLFEPDSVRNLLDPAAVPWREGKAEGITVGGNLSLLAATASSSPMTPGTPLPPPGAIGLLEDVGEPAYRLDRALTQLRATGWLSRLSGIVLGSWQDCGPDPETVAATLVDRLGDLGIPVVAEAGFGHGPEQRTVPIGVRARLRSTLASDPDSDPDSDRSRGHAELTPTEALLA